MTPKVVVITRSFGSTSDEPMKILKRHGCDVVTLDGSSSTDHELIEALADAEGLIIGGRPLPGSIIAAAPSLRVITMHGVGVDHIDVDAASARGIVVTNCPGANTDGVADLTFALMLAVARPIISANRALRDGGWGSHTGVEVWGKTLGLIGFGWIGSAVAKRALGFGMEVLVSDPFVSDHAIDAGGCVRASLDELLVRSDFVSLHAPLTRETRSIIDSAALERMKPSSYLVNTARGELVDETALIEALDAGQIAGAALDVFSEEPLVDLRLVEHERVVATPHIGSHSVEAISNASLTSARNTVLVLANEPPANRVN